LIVYNSSGGGNNNNRNSNTRAYKNIYDNNDKRVTLRRGYPLLPDSSIGVVASSQIAEEEINSGRAAPAAGKRD